MVTVISPNVWPHSRTRWPAVARQSLRAVGDCNGGNPITATLIETTVGWPSGRQGDAFSGRGITGSLLRRARVGMTASAWKGCLHVPAVLDRPGGGCPDRALYD